MKKILKIVLVATLLFTMVTMTACANDDAGFSLVSVDEEKANEQVVATVDGTDITKGEVINYLRKAAVLNGAPADYYFGEEMADQIEDIKLEVLNILIEEVTMKDKAAEFGLDQFTAEELESFKADADMFINSIESSIEMQVVEEFTALELEVEGAEFDAEIQRRMDEWYDAFGGGKDDIIESFKIEEISNRIQEYVFKDIDISEEEIKAFYDVSLLQQEEALKESPEMISYYEQMGAVMVFRTQDIFNVRHILISFDEADSQLVNDANAQLMTCETPEEEEAVKAMLAPAYKTIEPTILEVQAKIAEGADFGELVVEYGQDPGMASNPEGYPVIEGEGKYVTEFEAAAIALTTPGQISEPVKTTFGVHILELVSIDKAGAIDYEDIKETMRLQLLNDAKAQAWQESYQLWIDSTDRVEYINRLKD